MPLDPVRVADTRAWLTRAQRDIRGAEVDLAATLPLLDDVMFHCQQAVEKALKGFLERPMTSSRSAARCWVIDTTLAPLVKRGLVAVFVFSLPAIRDIFSEP